MKCPLCLTIKVYQDNTTMERLGDCLQGECAWWNRFTLECAIPMLALELNHLREYIHRIESKMPHEAQFRK